MGTASPSPPVLVRLSDIAWRGLVVAIAVLAVVAALAQLKIVVLPVFGALLITTLLSPVVGFMERRQVRRLLATWVTFAGFLGGAALVGAAIVPAVVDEFSGLGETLTEGVDDVQEWLVEGPLGLEQEELDRYREQAREQLTDLVRKNSDGIVAGALVVVEGFAGLILMLFLTFFFIKDGPHFQRWALNHLPAERHDVVRVTAARAWGALGGYLRGAALIGLLEAVVIGATVWIVGGRLILPVMVLTFAAAFFPILGAIVAGVVAVLVTLVSAGGSQALVVAVVALVVQQLDNDFLAPLIYGRMVSLHPVVVLLALTAGGTLAGIVGAFVAVPTAAVAVAVGGELWRRRAPAGT